MSAVEAALRSRIMWSMLWLRKHVQRMHYGIKDLVRGKGKSSWPLRHTSRVRSAGWTHQAYVVKMLLHLKEGFPRDRRLLEQCCEIVMYSEVAGKQKSWLWTQREESMVYDPFTELKKPKTSCIIWLSSRSRGRRCTITALRICLLWLGMVIF